VHSRDLPSGTVTFLFTDIEGSTRLLRELGEAYVTAFAEHRRILREAFTRHSGVELGTGGDAFFVVFRSATQAAAAAAEAQAALRPGRIWVRIGLHTGEPYISEGDYVGLDVHKAARIAACGHGGQVVLSAETQALLSNDVPLLDLGEHQLKDFDEPVQLFQLGDGRFPPLRTYPGLPYPGRPAFSFAGSARFPRS
jgi:class 3 adenylate cyclase